MCVCIHRYCSEGFGVKRLLPSGIVSCLCCVEVMAMQLRSALRTGAAAYAAQLPELSPEVGNKRRHHRWWADASSIEAEDDDLVSEFLESTRTGKNQAFIPDCLRHPLDAAPACRTDTVSTWVSATRLVFEGL